MKVLIAESSISEKSSNKIISVFIFIIDKISLIFSIISLTWNNFKNIDVKLFWISNPCLFD